MPTMRTLFRLATAGLVFFVLAALGSGLAFAQERQASKTDALVAEGYQLVAENDILRMYLDPARTRIAIYDRRNDKVWTSNPPESATQTMGSNLWKSHAASLISFTYTDARRRQLRESDPIAESATVRYTPIRDGVRITYEMQTIKMSIDVEFTLGADYFDVRIPDAGIREMGDHSLVYLEVLQFFGTATDADEGYMFFPDSSGAIAPFGKVHGRYSRQFEEYVYGPEAYPFIEYSPLIPVPRQVPMPVFGMKHKDGAFLGVITQGEYDAKIVAAPAGYIVDFYRTHAKFVLRREFVAPLRRDASVSTVEARRIPGDRAVRYYLLPEEQASYAGMALQYREHLVNTLNLKPGQVAGEDGVAPIHLRIFMGVVERALIFNDLIVMTTFEQAKRMVEDLMEAGVRELDVTLVGWGAGGYAGRLPRRLPVERAFGGERGLKEFVAWAEERGVRVYLQDNYIDAYAANGGFSTRTDVVRDPSKLPIEGWDQELRQDRYLISPLVALQRYAAQDIPKIGAMGVHGIEFERFGWTLLSDRNERSFAEREQVAEAWSKIVELALEHMNGVTIQGGNIYLLKYADKIMRSPMEETTHLFASRSVPFYQIAVHGIVPYYGWPGNLRSDQERQYLKNIEYGALPIFELTWESSALLKQARRYNILFSSQYEIWKPNVLKEYQEQAVQMGYLQDVAIVDHRELDTDVFETVYEDGSRVIVNYRETEWRQGDVTVGPLDYLLIRGGGASQ